MHKKIKNSLGLLELEMAVLNFFEKKGLCLLGVRPCICVFLISKNKIK
jgi:hypothetical protein